MNTSAHNKLISFIWSIADDCLRDIYNRGKYRDVILPMVVLRRLDALLVPTKDAVMEELRFQKEDAEFTEWDADGLKDASGFVFYNISKWTLRKLHNTATNSQQILLSNFEEYLEGFSPNVKEIIGKFKLKEQVRHMANKDILLDVLEKFTSPSINLTPFEKEDADGKKLPPLTNLGMGYVFEELIRKFNEENNEEAGEHFTPREVIDLMTHIVFDPLQGDLPPVMTIYDPACGSGGMLTESQNFIKDPEGSIKADGDVYLYGKEINDETYAICKSDMMIKGDNPENIRLGSTLSTDEFAGTKFDFMLSNPPYGKSWAGEQKHIKDGKDIIDPRFIVHLNDYWENDKEEDATPRSSDGQLLFLMEMVSKIKTLSQSPKGSRIASVHNGSSLFTGDAGGGESNIRRYIIENDLLDAIVQLPNNLFYNTGITTYIWLLSNNKPVHRKGKVQLLDASKLFRKLRKNLGNKNCEFSPAHIQEIVAAYTKFENKEADNSLLETKLFDNADFGYYKVTIERPERLKAQFTTEAIESLKIDKAIKDQMQLALDTYGAACYTDIKALEAELTALCEKQDIPLTNAHKKKLFNQKTWSKHAHLVQHAQQLEKAIGNDAHLDFNVFKVLVDNTLKKLDLKLEASDKKAILKAICTYDEKAEKVIKKIEKLTADKLATLLDYLGCKKAQLADFGYFPSSKPNSYTLYETASDLRDTENIPLKQNIHTYFIKEVKPHVSEAWIRLDATKIGYEISFNKYFYKHTPLRDIQAVAKEIMDLEKENEGLIADILNLR